MPLLKPSQEPVKQKRCGAETVLCRELISLNTKYNRYQLAGTLQKLYCSVWIHFWKISMIEIFERLKKSREVVIPSEIEQKNLPDDISCQLQGEIVRFMCFENLFGMKQLVFVSRQKMCLLRDVLEVIK
jgi:hypothetical protein